MRLLAVPDDGETVAAQAAGNRLDQHDGGRGGDGRVTALPPLSSMRNPACAASGCEVDTTLRANSGMRTEG